MDEREIERQAREHSLGATGRYPQGRVDPTDQGELRAGLTIDPDSGQLILSFGKPVAWLAMTPQQARAFAEALRKKSHEADQQKRR